ncbi:MAG TPA: AMIN domain-containing protein, partial [Nitrospirota bacterium]|nr:AMIN domain-containing protein [Nitrospirota bacterium]
MAFLFAGCSGNSAALRRGTGMATLEKVDVTDGENSTTVVLTVDRPVSFTSVTLAQPPKMVVELAGVELGGVKDVIKVGKGPVVDIVLSHPENAKKVARLEISLSAPASYKTAQNGSVISIIFDKTKTAAKPAAAPAPAAAEKKAAPPAPEEKIEVAEAAKPPAPAQPEKTAPAPAAAPGGKVINVEVTTAKADAKASRPAASQAAQAAAKKDASLPEAKTVGAISFTKDGDAVSVRLEGDGAFTKPEVFKLGGDRLVVDLPDTVSVRDKDTVEVGGKVLKRVRMAAHKDAPRKVRVVLDVAGAYDYEVRQEGKALVVTVAPAGMLAKAGAPKAAPAKPETAAKTEPPAKPLPTAKAEPAVQAKAAAPAKAEAPVNIYVKRENGKTVLSSSPIETDDAKSAAKPKEYVETETKIYTGGRISFDIQDADLDKVVKLLADVAGLNLIMDPAEVKGKVTLKLDNVPWDQALEILLRIYNLDKVIEGNVLRVASKSKLDEERRRELLQVAEQKKLEQQAEDIYTRTFKINYAKAEELEAKVKKVLSSRGDATANPRTNELIITDIYASLDRAGELIKILDKEVNQIMIEARIITVNVGYSRSLGVSWGLTRNSANNPKIGAGGGANSAG